MSYYDKNEHLCTEIISVCLILLLTILSIIVLRLSLSTKRRAYARKYTIDEVEEEKTITSEYLLSYILPLFAFDFTLWRQVVLFLIFFITLAILSIKHNHFGANVILDLFGYRFYKCKLSNENNKAVEKLIISREKLINYKNTKIIV